MILDQFGQPIRYIRKTEAAIEAEIAEELRAEEAARMQTPLVEIDDTMERVGDSLSDFYAERTRLVKAGLTEPAYDWRAARAEREAREAAADTVTPAEHKRACDEGRSKGFSEGYPRGVELGKEGERKRFAEIVRTCQGPRLKNLEAALNLALEFPGIAAEGCVDMAGRHFGGNTRRSASLADRENQMDSLQMAQAHWAAERGC